MLFHDGKPRMGVGKVNIDKMPCFRRELREIYGRSGRSSWQCCMSIRGTQDGFNILGHH